jgi:hypothetical protein
MKTTMKTQTLSTLPALLLATALGMSGASAANPNTPPPATLSEAGQKLEAEYTAKLESLKAAITGAVPKINPADQAAYENARKAELAAKAKVEEAQKNMGEVGRCQGGVGHAKGKWIGGAQKGIAETKAKLEKAGTDAEREAANKELAKWQQNLADGEAALKERQAQLDKALAEQPKHEQALKEAEAALAAAEAATMETIGRFGLKDLLSSDKLDAKLTAFVVLMEATPNGLAAFAQQGAEQKQLMDELFSNDALRLQMLVADGANGNQVGRAMEIYRDIRKASPKASEGVLQRLALAVALAHAVPVKQNNAAAKTDAPATVDPVQRYLHFEKAFLAGDLDPAFKELTVWDLRMVVDGEEPNEVLTWGREMLRNYRPDQVTKPDYNWRYVEIVRSDVRYGSQDNGFDEPQLHFFQNILKNGGVCGRRAFIGRFILRAFGIPTTARPQRGHAALVHWTPDGWVPCLGAGWGSGWTPTRYNNDLDFLANTQARAAGDAFLQVKRAQWIGDAMGEPRVFGFASGSPGFWYGVSLYTQRAIIQAAKARTLDAVGQDIAEANVTKEKIEIAKVTLTEEDRKIHTDAKGAIIIPAAATSEPTESTGAILFMDSVLGGKQLHYSRGASGAVFAYTIDAPAAGKYALTARVVTPSWHQSLMLTTNDAREPVEIPLPFTVGKWDTTAPVTIELNKGTNVLRFTRKSEGNEKGFSIKDFTLTPVSK